MKTLLIAALATLALSASAAEEEYVSIVTGKPVPKNGKYTVEQIKARDQRVLKKTGGFIDVKAEGPRILIVDARAKATATVDEVARLYKRGTHLDADVAKEPRDKVEPLAFAQAKMATLKPLMVVMVVDSSSLPALSVFPEERIGIVNFDHLKNAKGDPSAPEVRVSKELWRAIGFVGGVGFSSKENDMMQPYYTLEEIDACNYPYIQPMNMLKMQGMWKRFGVKKAHRVPYRLAVVEGWAANPTNDYQKAIWDEVHALPTAPIKIAPEAKKVEK